MFKLTTTKVHRLSSIYLMKLYLNRMDQDFSYDLINIIHYCS